MAEDRIDAFLRKSSVPIPSAEVCGDPSTSAIVAIQGPRANQYKEWTNIQCDDARARNALQDTSTNRAGTGPEVKDGEAGRHLGIKNIDHKVDSGEAIPILPQMSSVPDLEQASSKAGREVPGHWLGESLRAINHAAESSRPFPRPPTLTIHWFRRDRSPPLAGRGGFEEVLCRDQRAVLHRAPFVRGGE